MVLNLVLWNAQGNLSTPTCWPSTAHPTLPLDRLDPVLPSKTEALKPKSEVDDTRNPTSLSQVTCGSWLLRNHGNFQPLEGHHHHISSISFFFLVLIIIIIFKYYYCFFFFFFHFSFFYVNSVLLFERGE